jgi:hypothetical protein
MYPLDWRFPAGHRVAVLVTGSDDVWFEPSDTGTRVSVVSGTLSMLRVPQPHPALASGPFLPRTPHPPFAVDKATIEERTAH